jgi:2-methylcitrate dehydratase PrpD
MTELDPTAALARFAATTRYEDLDADLRHHVKRGILDGIGVGIGSLDQPGTGQLLAQLRELGGRLQASVWGSGEQLSVAQAAQVNGYNIHLLDYDDTYLPGDTLLHGEGPVLGAALAVAEWQQRSGRDLMTAFAVGFETECRVARCLGWSHVEPGWHTIGTCGGYGAVAAASRLLGLEERQVRHAFGGMSMQAAGTGELHGSTGKGLHAGNTAHNGVIATLLARRGMTWTERIFDTRRGCVPVMYSQSPNLERLTDGLGERWELRLMGFKPFCCGIAAQPLMTAMVELHRRYDVKPEQIAEVTGWVHPFVLVPMGKREPRDGMESKFSTWYAAAVTLVDGTGGKEQFTTERMRDPIVADVWSRVTVNTDESLPIDAARASVRLLDGRLLEVDVPHGKGTRDNPMTDEELEAKFRALVEPVIGKAGATRVIETVARLETVEDAGDLARATYPAA